MENCNELSSAASEGGLPSGLTEVNGVEFIRKMRGGAQSILVRCDDSKYYVVKMLCNPQGPNVLGNEYLGSRLATELGLPVPCSIGVQISKTFLESRPEAWFETVSGCEIPNAGLHFGSRYLGSPYGECRPSDYLSPSRISTVSNRSDFLGVLVFDVWANNQDSRQAIFLGNSTDRFLKAIFVDYGHMFGGPAGILIRDRGQALHLERGLYQGIWQDDAVIEWIFQMRKIIPKMLSRFVAELPAGWYSSDKERLIDLLLNRLEGLQRLVEPYKDLVQRPENVRTAHREIPDPIVLSI